MPRMDECHIIRSIRKRVHQQALRGDHKLGVLAKCIWLRRAAWRDVINSVGQEIQMRVNLGRQKSCNAVPLLLSEGQAKPRRNPLLTGDKARI